MASRGIMVTGTNGADFQHREKIAIQYQLRYVLLYHLTSIQNVYCNNISNIQCML